MRSSDLQRGLGRKRTTPKPVLRVQVSCAEETKIEKYACIHHLPTHVHAIHGNFATTGTYNGKSSLANQPGSKLLRFHVLNLDYLLLIVDVQILLSFSRHSP